MPFENHTEYMFAWNKIETEDSSWLRTSIPVTLPYYLVIERRIHLLLRWISKAGEISMSKQTDFSVKCTVVHLCGRFLRIKYHARSRGHQAFLGKRSDGRQTDAWSRRLLWEVPKNVWCCCKTINLTVAILQLWSFDLADAVAMFSSSNFSVFVFITALYFAQFWYTEGLAAGESVLSFTYS